MELDPVAVLAPAAVAVSARRGSRIRPGYGGAPVVVFKVGGGVSAPKVIYQPDPEYSEEARKAKFQGTCVLWLIVGPDGKPRDVQVRRTLGWVWMKRPWKR